MIDVNITCTTCDGTDLCERCTLAGEALAGTGARVTHAARYDALRAAQAGSAMHSAYVIPVGAGERGVLEALGSLFQDVRVLIVADGDIGDARMPASFSVVAARDYALGRVPIHWLSERPAMLRAANAEPETAAVESPAPDRDHATRRLRGVASAVRKAIADPDSALDMLATLDDEVLWAQASGTRFAVVLAHLPGLARRESRADAALAEEQLTSVHHAVRGAVRASDVVAGRNDDVLVVMPEADRAGAALVAERVARALAALPAAAASWSVGVAVFPDDGAAREAILARATVTLRPIIAPPEA